MDVLLDWSLTIGLVLVVVGCGLWIGLEQWSARRRTSGLAPVATHLGFDLDGPDRALDDANLDVLLTSLPVFERGRRPRAANLMRREDGDGTWILFDFAHRLPIGRQERHDRHTMLAYQWKTPARVPGFAVRLEHQFGLGLDVTWGAAVAIDRNLGLAERRIMSGPDPEQVSAYLTPERLHAVSAHVEWCVEGTDRWLLLYKHRTRVAPERLAEFVAEARGLALALRP
jgi:hypothetical protein